MDIDDGQQQTEDGIKILVPHLSRNSYSENRIHAAFNGNGTNSEADSESFDAVDTLPEVALTQQENAGAKRKHVPSRRMQEYQQSLTTSSINKQERKCPFCDRILTSGPGYRYHVKSHSQNNESYICDMCNKEFKSSNGLKYHKKRKRCRGDPALFSTTGSPKLEHSPEDPQDRLLELATIATGPQSPLLHCQGSSGRVSSSTSPMVDPETTAVMALSSMKTKCSSEVKKSSEKPSSSLHLSESQKPKRPMNGFMLFAQKYRTELNKKYPTMNNRMISTKLSEEWKKLQETERMQWKKDARLKAEEHQKVYPNCWKRKKEIKDTC